MRRFFRLFLTVFVTTGSGCAQPFWQGETGSLRSVFRAQNLDAWGWSTDDALPPPPQSGPPADNSSPPLQTDQQIPGGSTDQSVPLLLQDAISLALQNSQTVRTMSGDSVSISATTLYDPMILEQRWRMARAAFDPRIDAGYVGSTFDQPPDSFFGPGIPLNVQRDEGNFSANLVKSWETGGTTSVGFLPPLAYLFYPDQSSDGFNPVYAADLVFELKQPLLRGAGIGVNTAPIRIAQIRHDQSTWDLKAAMLGEVRSIEEAYWTLQAAAATLQSFDAVMPLLDEQVRIEQLRLEAELVTRAEVARTRLQRSQFQQQRVRAAARVRERELRLRQLMGLPAGDGRRLIPVNPPVRRLLPTNPAASIDTAMQNRPDLIRQRLNVEIRDLEFVVAKSGRLPLLDARVLHRASGLGEQLDKALEQMQTFRYTDWTFGLTASMPIGNRAPRANMRAAEAQLLRKRDLLLQSVQNVEFTLADIQRELHATWGEYEAAQNRFEESREWVKVARIRFQNPPPTGSGQDWLILALNEYQQSIRSHVDAVGDSASLLAAYNTWLARLEEAEGTLLTSRRVMLENDPCRTVQEFDARRSDSHSGNPAPTEDSSPSTHPGADEWGHSAEVGAKVDTVKGQPDKSPGR